MDGFQVRELRYFCTKDKGGIIPQKTRMIKRLFLLCLSMFLFQTSAFSAEQIWQKPVEEGIKYHHIKRNGPDGYLHIHLLAIDLANEKISVRPELARGELGTLEETSNIALNSNAIAAVNGSFFVTRKGLNLPIGNLMIDKKLVSRSILNRTTIGFTEDKKIIFGIPNIKAYVINRRNRKGLEVWGINRPRKLNETVIFTNEFGKTTRTNQWGKEICVDKNLRVIKKYNLKGDSEIPEGGLVVSLHGWSRDFFDDVRIGDRFEIKYRFIKGWQNVNHAVTGGPLLIKDGEIVVNESIKEEKFGKYLLHANSRTAIGVGENGELILAVIDKRNAISKGSTYDELAKILKEFGVKHAMGLDGGGTSTMYIAGRVVNYPLNAYERAVSNAIIVQYKDWNMSESFAEGRIFSSSTAKLTDKAFGKIIMEKSILTPASYVHKPEDFGLYGLMDIYQKVLKPVIPKALMEANSSEAYYTPASFLSDDALSVFSHGRSRSGLPK